MAAAVNLQRNIPHKRQGVQPFTACLQRVTKQAFKGPAAFTAAIMLDWPLMVGPALAQQCSPHKIKPAGGGLFTLELAASSAAAAMLQYLVPDILEKINTYMGRRCISKITFCHMHATKRAAPAARQMASNPKTNKELEPLTDSLDDGPLKNALAQLAKHL